MTGGLGRNRTTDTRIFNLPHSRSAPPTYACRVLQRPSTETSSLAGRYPGKMEFVEGRLAMRSPASHGRGKRHMGPRPLEALNRFSAGLAFNG